MRQARKTYEILVLDGPNQETSEYRFESLSRQKAAILEVSRAEGD